MQSFNVAADGCISCEGLDSRGFSRGMLAAWVCRTRLFRGPFLPRCQPFDCMMPCCFPGSRRGQMRWKRFLDSIQYQWLTDYLREVCAQEFWGDPRNLRGGWWPHSFGFSDPQYLAGSALFELVRNCRRVLFWATFSLALLRHHIGVCGH